MEASYIMHTNPLKAHHNKLNTINDVKRFWDENPLWTGESQFPPGTREFFDEHKKVYINDCFAGRLDEKLFPDDANKGRVLDLGCGPGFWTVELILRGSKKLIAADLTENAIQLTKKRCQIYHCENVDFALQNAENMTFHDEEFSHVNCQGVIHHTPDTDKAVSEIARVLKTGGTAMISVYYKNFFLRNWDKVSWIGRMINRMGGKLTGRGREKIYAQTDINEIVRLYDGSENPIGKAYSLKEFREMLEPHFKIEKIFFHFFPARTLPFPIPKVLHRLLDKKVGFMVFAKLKKR